MLTHFSCVWFFATLATVARQTPLSMGFSRQEYRSGLLFPSPGDLPNPGIKPRSSALQATSLPYEPWGRRENSSIAFWSHQSRSVDIDSNPLPDLHKFLFQMETGRRVHFFFFLWNTTRYEHWQFKYCTLIYGEMERTSIIFGNLFSSAWLL